MMYARCLYSHVRSPCGLALLPQIRQSWAAEKRPNVGHAVSPKLILDYYSISTPVNEFYYTKNPTVHVHRARNHTDRVL